MTRKALFDLGSTLTDLEDFAYNNYTVVRRRHTNAVSELLSATNTAEIRYDLVCRERDKLAKEIESLKIQNTAAMEAVTESKALLNHAQLELVTATRANDELVTEKHDLEVALAMARQEADEEYAAHGETLEKLDNTNSEMKDAFDNVNTEWMRTKTEISLLKEDLADLRTSRQRLLDSLQQLVEDTKQESFREVNEVETTVGH
jgi:chromosome segregation ATPase